jgi:hypothetical protein
VGYRTGNMGGVIDIAAVPVAVFEHFASATLIKE